MALDVDNRTYYALLRGVARLLIRLSSGCGEARCEFELVRAVVAQQCPRHVDTSAGQGEHGLGVPLPSARLRS